ncbi:MAG: GNAT family N-acetyltransferase [Candidatus Heimdallarchaeota archaeon]|nr:GNAT family N-acetyltransferase [Candidatus Heimdallarchaeota archaeon]MCK5298270.1 GNAT family N-acetyltransferase [Candidatus Heimdallarchaeota archaeon]
MHLPDFLKEEWMKKTEIRLSKKEEIPILKEIIVEAYTPIEPILGRKPRGMLETEEKVQERVENNTVYSVLYEGKLIGTFTIKENTNFGLMEVQKIAIREEMQNKGLGSFIVESAEHLIRLMEKKKIIVETYEDHKQLVDFYLHRGYKIFHKRMRKGNVVLVMEKNLWRED